VTPPTTTAVDAAPGRDFAIGAAVARVNDRALPAAGRAASAHTVDLAAKRALDITVSVVLLLLCLPLFLVIAVLIKLDSRGPLFFGCRRVGRDGRDLLMLKFRKMRDGADGPALTLSQDERFTRIGPFLAATKLDELPQLLNVLRGDMSLVGPRPEDATFVDLRRDEYAAILRVKPGMTGLTQLAFANERDILDRDDAISHYVEQLLPQKIDIDKLYASSRTIGMDARILVWTAVAVVLRREVAVHRDSARITLRRRPTARRAIPAAALAVADRRER